MPTPTVSKVRPLCPEGEFVFRLASVEEKSVKSDFAKTDDGKVTKWLWKFEALDEVDDNDEPYEAVKFTGTSFGDARAELTKWLRAIYGKDYGEADAAQLDTDELVGKRFRLTIIHSDDDKGNTRANIVKVVMLKKNGGKPKLNAEEDFGD